MARSLRLMRIDRNGYNCVSCPALPACASIGAMFRFVIAYGIVITLTFLVGCRSEDEIRTYVVPKDKSRTSIVKPQAAEREPTDRMLVAVVPHGGQAFFFKVVGPISQVDLIANEVKQFVESLEVNGDDPPTWELPEGWREGAGNEFRLATLLVPAGNDTIELTINRMPWQTSDSFLLANLNRWRAQQLNMQPIGPAQLDDSYEKFKLGDTEVIWVDLLGRSSDSGMAPFAGRQSKSPPTVQDLSQVSFDQQAPEGWQPLPLGGSRRAAFQIGEGADAALATVSAFPKSSGPQITSPLANINMWRGAVGLPPVEESDVAKIAQQATISGIDAIIVEMQSPEGNEPSRATFAAMFEYDQSVWFVKLAGATHTVLAERENFRKWLESIQFSSTANEN